jgi:phage terminase large subunit
VAGFFVWENLSENPLIPFILKFGPAAGEEGPVLFAREVFGVELDPWQERTLRAFGRGERRISIRACHGPGKTFVAAVCAIWQLVTRYPQKTVATAPSRSQLEDALMAEVMVLFSKLPEVIRQFFLVKQNRIEMAPTPSNPQAGDSSFFSARTARAETPEALAGVHCDEGWVLLIGDEASAIPEKIYETAAGSMSGFRATTLLLSNPSRPQGFFYDTHHKLRDMWFTVHVSGVEGVGEHSPRVTPDFVEDIARRYGEKSDAFRIRVLGEFPSGADDAIIPYDLILAAQDLEIDVPDSIDEIWGVDIARYGHDECSLVKRNKVCVLPTILTWSKSSLMETCGRIKAEYDKSDRKPSEILIDDIGMGGGVVDRLLELGVPGVRGVNISLRDVRDDRYYNIRTELYFTIETWLTPQKRSLPKKCACDNCVRDPRNNHAEQLAQELAAQRKKYSSSGKILAVPKDEIKKDLGRSPNVADALALTFASEPAVFLNGSNSAFNSGTNWQEPVRRNRAIV